MSETKSQHFVKSNKIDLKKKQPSNKTSGKKNEDKLPTFKMQQGKR